MSTASDTLLPPRAPKEKHTMRAPNGVLFKRTALAKVLKQLHGTVVYPLRRLTDMSSEPRIVVYVNPKKLEAVTQAFSKLDATAKFVAKVLDAAALDTCERYMRASINTILCQTREFSNVSAKYVVHEMRKDAQCIILLLGDVQTRASGERLDFCTGFMVLMDHPHYEQADPDLHMGHLSTLCGSFYRFPYIKWALAWARAVGKRTLHLDSMVHVMTYYKKQQFAPSDGALDSLIAEFLRLIAAHPEEKKLMQKYFANNTTKTLAGFDKYPSAQRYAALKGTLPALFRRTVARAATVVANEHLRYEFNVKGNVHPKFAFATKDPTILAYLKDPKDIQNQMELIGSYGVSMFRPVEADAPVLAPELQSAAVKDMSKRVVQAVEAAVDAKKQAAAESASAAKVSAAAATQVARSVVQESLQHQDDLEPPSHMPTPASGYMATVSQCVVL
jgi:hypothetical protein